MNETSMKKLKTALFVVILTALAAAVLFSTAPSAVKEVSVAEGASGFWTDYKDISWYTSYPSRGTIEDPYIISTAEELAGLAYLVVSASPADPTVPGNGIKFTSKYIWVTSDIDLSDHYWNPIGKYGFESSQRRPFEGILDFGVYREFEGTTTENVKPTQGFLIGRRTVSGMVYDSGSTSNPNSGGLFGFINYPGILKNLIIDNSSVTLNGQGEYMGLAVGFTKGGIDNVETTSSCSVTVLSHAGSGASNIGGIAGSVRFDFLRDDGKNSIDNCVNAASVTKGQFAGGIVGDFANDVTPHNDLNNIRIKNSINRGYISGKYAGGISGAAGSGTGASNIEKCANVGQVTAILAAGGIVGYARTGIVVVKNCYNLGTVRYKNVNDDADGSPSLKEFGSLTINSNDKVSGIGGIAGRSDFNTSSISSSYSAGQVFGGDPSNPLWAINSGMTVAFGAVAGIIDTDEAVATVKTVTSCYYLDGSSPATAGYPTGSGIGLANLKNDDILTGSYPYSAAGYIEPKTDTQLKSHATFVNWDFGEQMTLANPEHPWRMIPGNYPKLIERNVYVSVTFVANEIPFDSYSVQSHLFSPTGYDFSYKVISTKDVGATPAGTTLTSSYPSAPMFALVSAPNSVIPAPVNTGEYTAYIIIDDGNYFGYAKANFRIIPREVLVAPKDGLSKTYGDADPAFDSNAIDVINSPTQGFLGADGESNPFSGAFTRAPGFAVGAYSYSNSTLACRSSNYVLVFTNTVGGVERKFTINKRPLNITAQSLGADGSVTYGNLDYNYGFIQSGLVNGDVITINSYRIDTSVIATNGAAYPHAGSYTAIIYIDSYQVSANYQVTTYPGNLTISKAELSITVANTVKTYGEALDSSAFSISGVEGLKNGDTLGMLSLSQLVSDGASEESEARASGYDIRFTTAPNHADYRITAVNGKLTVLKRALSYSFTTVPDRVYSASDNFSWSNVPVSGILAFDSGKVTVSFTAKYSNGGNAGNAVTLGATTSTLTGTRSGNYSVTELAAGVLSGNINKAPLSIRFKNQTITYGQKISNSTATILSQYLEFTGFKGSDTYSSALSGEIIKNLAGTDTDNPRKPASSEGYEVSVRGFNSANYEITYIDGRVFINKQLVTVSGISAYDKVYDGTTAAQLQSTTPSYIGFLAGDDVRVDSLVVRFASPNAGNSVSLVVDSFTLGGVHKDNYIVSLAAVGTAKITRARLTITINDATRYFGEEDPEFTFTLSGFVNGETAEGIGLDLTKIRLYTDAVASSPAGGDYIIQYDLSQVSNMLVNYYVESSRIARMRIEKIALDVSEIYPALDGVKLTKNQVTLVYDGATHFFTIETGELVAEELTIDYLFQDGTLEGGKPAMKDSKIYRVSASIVVGQNYIVSGSNVITTETYTIIINKAPIKVKVNNYEIDTADSLPEFGFTIVEGELFGSDTEADLGIAEYFCTAENGSPAGSYLITATFTGSKNYTVTAESG
ncbi:MAG TPA: MBG domain-containing protein, partial [Clostridia bacterium]|nr:MBG domain-containing protein [Clostridia bacterium]